MTTKLLLKILPYLLLAGLLVYAGHKTYTSIYNAGVVDGKAQVQREWDIESAAYVQSISDQKAKYEVKEELSREENKRITRELNEANKTHAVAVAELTAAYEHRLQLSAQRASVYQRQAQGGPAECRSLAEHTSRLDSSLEEGRSLVRELRETLGLRDKQLTAVGNQLLTDRKLFTDDTSEVTK